MEKRIKSMINETTEQIKLFLNVDSLASSAIADNILEDDDVISKLSKFNRLVIDRLSFSHDPTKYNSTLILNLMKNTRNIIPGAPKDSKEFSKWLPETLKYQRDEVKKLKKKLINCQKDLLQTQVIIDEFSKKSVNEKNKLVEEMKYLKKENRLLNERFEDREDFIKFNKSQISITEAKLQNAETTIRKLRDENGKMKLEISDKDALIRSLKAENSDAIREVKSACSNAKNDIYEKKELALEIERLEKAMKQTEKLQNLPCGCFDDDVNWVKAHKDLHRQLNACEEEKEELKSYISSLENKLNDKKSKSHKVNIKRIRQKVETLKSNVEDIKHEIY